jgi:hypothetical protein
LVEDLQDVRYAQIAVHAEFLLIDVPNRHLGDLEHCLFVDFGQISAFCKHLHPLPKLIVNDLLYLL